MRRRTEMISTQSSSARGTAPGFVVIVREGEGREEVLTPTPTAHSTTTTTTTTAPATSTSSSSSSSTPNPSAPTAPPSTPSDPNPANPDIGTINRKKRPYHLICNGRTGSWRSTMADYNCPICIGVLNEAVITKCGHTFCNSCIRKSLATKAICATCGTAEHPDNLVPNYLANQVVRSFLINKRQNAEMVDPSRVRENPSLGELLQNLNCERLSIEDVDNILTIFKRKREVLSTESKEHEFSLLKDFLSQFLTIKKAEKERIDKEVRMLERDLTEVNSRPPSSFAIGNLPSSVKSLTPSSTPVASPSPSCSIGLPSGGVMMDVEDVAMTMTPGTINGFNTQVLVALESKDKSLAAKRKRLYSHFDELMDIYMDLRKPILDVSLDGSSSAGSPSSNNTSNDATVPSDVAGSGIGPVDVCDFEDLDKFGHTLSRIARYSALKPLATLSYSADQLSNNNIVSSIEFDKDSEYFAIAGVTKKIKIFEYATVIGSSVDIHCPTAELMCAAKISCVSWSGYYKNKLASSDYDGCVTLWDANTLKKTTIFNEHEKRVWSVDWSNGNPSLLASGSDDSKVKLWSTQQDRPNSVATIEAKANVCCVKFCPKNSFVVAFGCADHCIHYYDFRHPKHPLAILAGHKKAVSYVKFASEYELVSASTDSHLKLWNLNDSDGAGIPTESVRSFTGHTNEKNFVGLATDGNYIACGSENNSLYIYYRNLSQPLLHFKFDNHRNMLEKPKQDDAGEFVSAVVWKRDSPVVVAANSQGSIKILELT